MAERPISGFRANINASVGSYRDVRRVMYNRVHVMTVHPVDPKPPDEDLTKEFTAGVRGLFERIGDFFHLFDLSFFVSGATILAAGAYWYSRHQKEIGYTISSATWIRALIVVVASYVLGLIAFGAGRSMSYVWRANWFPEAMRNLVQSHDLTAEIPDSYIQGDIKPWRLYERLWVDLRESRKHAVSFQLLNRYWVLSATYDGIAVACLVWTAVLVFEPLMPSGNWRNWCLPLIPFAAAVVCWRQANNYLKYQLREILAIIASSKRRLLV